MFGKLVRSLLVIIVLLEFSIPILMVFILDPAGTRKFLARVVTAFPKFILDKPGAVVVR